MNQSVNMIAIPPGGGNNNNKNNNNCGCRCAAICICRVPLLESVVEHGWCQLVPRLLAISEHDAREKILAAMWSLREPCRADFADHLSMLERLHGEYTQLSEMEIRHHGSSSDEPPYFTELLRTVDYMIRHVTVAKDEL